MNKCCDGHSGKRAHQCLEYDLLWICEDCPEFENCLCFKKQDESDVMWANNRIDDVIDAPDTGFYVTNDGAKQRLVQLILEAMARGWLQRGKYE